MFPKIHIIFGFIFSLILLLLFPEIGWFGFISIFASSVLIDVDHYLFYAVTKKDWSLKNAYNWFVEGEKKFKKLLLKEKKESKQIPCIFHGIEFIIILLVLIYFNFYRQFLIYILLGIVFHQVLDFIYIKDNHFKLNHLGSQIYNIIVYIRNP
jgi:hypothetical protein